VIFLFNCNKHGRTHCHQFCYHIAMKSRIATDNAPKADHILSQGIVSNGCIYVAGQIHNKPEGSMVVGSVKEKTDQIMQNISAILKAADATLNDIVKVVIYVTDMGQMPELNEVYPSYFTEPYPVREAVCVQALPLGATIEISVVAAK
jgi:2-iminobutanoate/2-iminopropanoate deaminase